MILKRKGIVYQQYFLDQDLAYEIHAMISVGTENIALILASQKCFACNVNKMLGSILDQREVLEKVGGYRVEVIPYFEFNTLKKTENQVKYIE